MGGSVKAEKAGKADCTITVSDANFMALASGKANAQQLFMQGKVKLQGNMALAMKLEQVIKANRPSPQKAAESKQAAANVESGFEADAIFPGLGEAIKADPAMVKRINGVYEFNITGKNNTKTVWT